MKRIRVASSWVGMVALVLLLTAGPHAAHAAILTLQNDGFVAGDSVSFQMGFVTGEIGASTLGPVDETFQVNKIHFLFGPGGTPTQTITLRIYLDTGGTNPGAEIFSADYSVTPASDAMQEIDLTVENVVVTGGGSIRVGIEMQHDGAPAIARDDDGNIMPAMNWIMSQTTWTDASTVGLVGDWIIRAEVETQDAPDPDAGVPEDGSVGEDGSAQEDAAAQADSGDVQADSAVQIDSGTSSGGDDSGCNCAATGPDRSAAAGALALLLLILGTAFFNRRRSS